MCSISAMMGEMAVVKRYNINNANMIKQTKRERLIIHGRKNVSDLLSKTLNSLSMRLDSSDLNKLAIVAAVMRYR